MRRIGKILFFVAFLFLLPVVCQAVNDFVLDQEMEFEFDTIDSTPVAVIAEAQAGGVFTHIDVYHNYLELTMDNGTEVNFVIPSGYYFRYAKVSGSNDYTVTPTCLSNSIILKGTGATVVIKITVTKSRPVCLDGGGGGGGGGGSTPIYPTNPSILINNNASVTNSGNVSLQLSANSASQVMYSNNSDFSDASWSAFMNPLTVVWTLTPNYGEKKVYAMFKSVTGHTSTAVFDNIEYSAALPEDEEPIEPPTQPGSTCVLDCNKVTFNLYIVNPDGTFRDMNSHYARVDNLGNNISLVNFEDSGSDFDYNDIVVRVDKSDCNKIVVTPTNLDAGWHHQIWIKLLYEGTIKKDLLLWSDSHTAIGVSKEIKLSDHSDLCLGAEITTPSSTTDVLNVDPYNDTSFKGIVRGKLLLQVEDRGRIWYVDPASDLRYEVTRENAMDLFRSLSLGITNLDLYKIPINQGLNNRDNLELRLRVRGRILLQVEARGQTWYVIPGELRRVQVTSADLYDIFRNYSLGITNADLEMIPSGDLSQDPVEKANPVPIAEPVIQPSVCATSINFNTDLFPGDSGSQVLELQKLLKCLTYFPADVVANGNFGPITTASVQQFQTANNISSTGNVGPLTREILNRY